MVTQEQIIKWLKLTANVIQDNKEWLTQLDAAIGDGEHGINMARGFQKVSSHLPSVADKDIGSILKSTGTILLSAVGGAGGIFGPSSRLRGSGRLSGSGAVDSGTGVMYPWRANTSASTSSS